MSTGLLIGISCIYFLHFAADNHPRGLASILPSALHEIRTQSRLKNLDFVLLLIVLYYIPSLSGIWYPGAAWTDSEFGEGRPQLFMFPVLLLASWWAYRTEQKTIVAAHMLELAQKD